MGRVCRGSLRHAVISVDCWKVEFWEVRRFCEGVPGVGCAFKSNCGGRGEEIVKKAMKK